MYCSARYNIYRPGFFYTVLDLRPAPQRLFGDLKRCGRLWNLPFAVSRHYSFFRDLLPPRPPINVIVKYVCLSVYTESTIHFTRKIELPWSIAAGHCLLAVYRKGRRCFVKPLPIRQPHFVRQFTSGEVICNFIEGDSICCPLLSAPRSSPLDNRTLHRRYHVPEPDARIIGELRCGVAVAEIGSELRNIATTVQQHALCLEWAFVFLFFCRSELNMSLFLLFEHIIIIMLVIL